MRCFIIVATTLVVACAGPRGEQGPSTSIDTSKTIVLCTTAAACIPGQNVFNVPDTQANTPPGSFVFPHGLHGKDIIAVWYTPLDNIKDTTGIDHIEIHVLDDQNLRILASGHGAAIVRLQLFMAYKG